MITASFLWSGCSGSSALNAPLAKAKVPISTGGAHLIAVMPSAISNAQIDANISPGITGSDRQVVHDLMLKLRPESRKNVIYFAANGRIYANRSELLKGVGIAQPVPGKPRTYRHANGEQFTVPMNVSVVKPTDHQVKPQYYSPPDGSTTTGPYRRIFSNTGYSYSAGNVDTPCNPSNFPATVSANDTGYLYIGGWSDTGDQVDAGLQYSSVYNDYEPYFLHAGDPPADIAFSYPCGNSAYMEFYVVDSTHVDLTINGFDSTGAPSTYSYVGLVPVGNGWSPDGSGPQGGGVMKRALSIAQASQSLNNGDYFGYDPVNKVPTIGWSQWQVGTNYAPGGNYPSVPLDNTTGGSDLFPSNGDVHTAPFSNSTNPFDEVEGIYLDPNNPAP